MWPEGKLLLQLTALGAAPGSAWTEPRNDMKIQWERSAWCAGYVSAQLGPALPAVPL